MKKTTQSSSSKIENSLAAELKTEGSDDFSVEFAEQAALSVFFFKQKTAYEIHCVTGVQTCALPISGLDGIITWGTVCRVPEHQHRHENRRNGEETGDPQPALAIPRAPGCFPCSIRVQ